MAKIISFLNYKGGVAKSTSAVNVAKALHDKGFKVLVIDADSQGNASKMMGKNLSEGNDVTLYEVLVDGIDIRESINIDQDKDDSFDYVPSNLKLNKAEMQLASEPTRMNILKKAIAPIRDYYDFILIDCTPTDGVISQAAITASDYLLVPLKGETFAADGMGRIIKRYKEISEDFNKDLKILGYFFTMIRKCQLHDTVKGDVRKQHQEEKWPGDIFRSEIKLNVRIAETPSFRTNIFDYKDQFNPELFTDKAKIEAVKKGSDEYRALAEEILEKIEKYN